MAQTITVQCPQGIQSLIDLGRAVASQRAWGTHPRAKEAFVGLWLDAVLTRAELRGRTEVIGNRVQAVASNETLSGDDAKIDQVAANWLQFAQILAPQSGSQAEQVNLALDIGGTTEGWPLAVSIAAIVTGGAVIAVFGIKNLDNIKAAISNWQGASVLAQGTAEALKIADRCREERRACTPEERTIIDQTMANAQKVGVQMAKTGQQKGGLFGGLFDDPTTTLLVAAVAVAAIWGGSKLLGK